MISLQLSKSVKSLQVRLNEAMFLTKGLTVTGSAYSQARQKYSHTAFIELSDFTRKYYYEHTDYQTWHGYRVSAIDGSLLILPHHDEIIESFGTRHIPETKTQNSEALAMCRLLASYDVLNHIVHDASLARCNSYEVEAAHGLLAPFTANDVVLFDRHYASYEFIARLTAQNCHFVIRCPKSTFREGNRVFQDGPWTREVFLEAPAGTKKFLKLQQLPTQVKVRFVRVKLSTGETELLVSSLLEPTITATEFRELYGLRWGVETLYDLLKTRLNLENFSGYSLESVKQDIFASIFITNMETLLTQDIEEALKRRSTHCKYTKKINKVIAFNAIKHEVFDLIYNQEASIDDVLEKLMALFITNPTLVKPERHFERHKTGPFRRLRHHKTKRKICF